MACDKFVTDAAVVPPLRTSNATVGPLLSAVLKVYACPSTTTVSPSDGWPRKFTVPVAATAGVFTVDVPATSPSEAADKAFVVTLMGLLLAPSLMNMLVATLVKTAAPL